MPELPEIETIKLSLEPLVLGRTIEAVDVRCGKLRRPLAPALPGSLTGRSLVGLRRRAKYLLFDLDDGACWLVHLGMSGRLLHCGGGSNFSPACHDHVVVALSDGGRLAFNDPRRFGLMAVEKDGRSSLLAGLGPEPLDAGGFDADYLASLRRRTNRTVKEVLMDQRMVAGLGNIYTSEILFVAGLSPRRRLGRLSREDCRRVVDATRTILTEAIEHRGTSFSDFLDGLGRRGGYQWRRRVYGRAGEPCPCCSAKIKSIKVGRRSSFYCPACQR